MRKILQIIDFKGWAIDELASSVVKYNPQYQIRQLYIHPRDAEVNVFPASLKEDIAWCDLIDFQYWRTASFVMQAFPEVKTKPKILTHHNEKNLLSENWQDIDLHIAETAFSVEQLETVYDKSKIKHIPVSYDPEVFHFNDAYPPEKPAVGYVGRIAPWKGLKEVARACYELKVPLKIMGKMDKQSYWEEIPEEHRQNIDMEFYDCPDGERPNFYKTITCYVGNSGTGRETGTMGFIEAMASGVPVVTTPAGLARDICEDGVNSLLVPVGDYEQLKFAINKVMSNPDLCNTLRNGGWDTIKGFNHERTARQKAESYSKVLYPDEPMVSVIIPATFDRAELVVQILDSLEVQSYKNIEALVVWDENKWPGPEIDYTKYRFPLRKLFTNREGYNLAMARNMGVIHSFGKYLVFCDNRLKPLPDSIKIFVDRLSKATKKTWFFGEKGGGKKNFVENFSAIKREDLIKGGMFNERINRYGGMSQELRERFMEQGFELKYLPEAQAVTLASSKKTSERRDDIISMKNLLWKLGI